MNGEPKPTLSFLDAVAAIVGIVVGAGIFKTPALVAANVGNGVEFLGIWLLGAIVSLVGAICYAELASTYPDAGGEYHYLTAFLVGDYLSLLLPLGEYSSSFHAAAAIVVLTAINLAGIQPGKWAQNLLTASKILGLSVAIASLPDCS